MNVGSQRSVRFVSPEREEPKHVAQRIHGLREWDWSYVSEDEVSLWVGGAPIWGQLYRALSELPAGKMVKLPVPEDLEIKKLRKRVASAVRNQFVQFRWQIRTSLDRSYIVIKQNGTWKARQEELREMERELGI